jgi:hypothetical protein
VVIFGELQGIEVDLGWLIVAADQAAELGS